MSVIELNDVSVTFHEGGRTVEAVKHVNISVEKGEIFGIVGFSGAGKSTLVCTINLLERPTGGHVVIDGSDITALKGGQLRDLRKKIGFIFQQFHLLPVLTARENILMPLLLDKVRPDETQLMRIAGFLGLEDRLSHLPHELSGGQQQRVAVARALIAGPDILFADEPTGNLDSKSGGEVMEMLCTIRKSLGKTLILITHDKQLAEMAERRFTIVDGVLREVTEA